MIVVLGSINLDLVATVERLPRPGETVPGSSFVSNPGGKGANQAVAAARAGAEVRMIGAVGRDPFADQALAGLVSAGVDLAGVRAAAAATGTALILVDARGENVIAVVPGANGTVLKGDLAAADLQPGDVLVLQQEIPVETVSAALDHARAVGARTVLNTAPFLAETAGLLQRADIVVANETEFDLYAKVLSLSRDDRDARMRSLAATTGCTIVLTLGAEGAVAVGPTGRVAAPALALDPVDTVGAGDTFCGYLAAGLAQGLDLHAALIRAAAAGSLACLKPGAQTAIPTAVEVDRALTS